VIFFDETKSVKAKHASGLMRVNRRLREELGRNITPVEWGRWDYSAAKPDDWYLTTEMFDADTRPAFREFLADPPCRLAALFPDAIPLQHPRIVWPHAVARHPHYMDALSRFDHVFAISEKVRRDLRGFWQWQGKNPTTQVSVLPLGADFDGSHRSQSVRTRPQRSLLCVGIVEPRKNQSFLLDVAESLWREGEAFDLHFIGRINPHFGREIAQRIKRSAVRFQGLHFHERASDEVFAGLLERSRAVLFPTIAEGCGLPVLEALWRGLPCVCSDLPVLQENTQQGGCLALSLNDLEAWRSGLRRILNDDDYWSTLASEAVTRTLPCWKDAAQIIGQTLSASP